MPVQKLDKEDVQHFVIKKSGMEPELLEALRGKSSDLEQLTKEGFSERELESIETDDMLISVELRENTVDNFSWYEIRMDVVRPMSDKTEAVVSLPDKNTAAKAFDDLVSVVNNAKNTLFIEGEAKKQIYNIVENWVSMNEHSGAEKGSLSYNQAMKEFQQKTASGKRAHQSYDYKILDFGRNQNRGRKVELVEYYDGGFAVRFYENSELVKEYPYPTRDQAQSKLDSFVNRFKEYKVASKEGERDEMANEMYRIDYTDKCSSAFIVQATDKVTVSIKDVLGNEAILPKEVFNVAVSNGLLTKVEETGEGNFVAFSASNLSNYVASMYKATVGKVVASAVDKASRGHRVARMFSK